MKKFSTIFLILIFTVFLMAGSSLAEYFTYTEEMLLEMDEVWDNPEGSADLLIYGSYGSGPEFTIIFTAWDPTTGFAQIGIGDYDYTNRMDLSSYEGIKLRFENSTFETTADMWVNLFIQTYDPRADRWDNFYENTWTEILEGQSSELTLDFLAADYWLGGSYIGNVAVNNLENVYKWGFQIGNNIDENVPNLIHGAVNPIPEPATMLLFGTGLIGIAGIGRKKFLKR